MVPFLPGVNNLEVEARCTEEGVLSLEGVLVLAYRMVQVPRIWDDPALRFGEARERLERAPATALGTQPE